MTAVLASVSSVLVRNESARKASRARSSFLSEGRRGQPEGNIRKIVVDGACFAFSLDYALTSFSGEDNRCCPSADN